MNKILSVLLIVLVGFQVSEARTVPEKSRKTVRLVTYNVGVFSKYEKNSTTMIADMMREIDADIISMNELDSCAARTGNVYQLEKFASEMGGTAYLFGRAMPYDGGAYGDGIVVRDKASVIDMFSVILPQADGAEPRALVVAELEDYVFASTHLDHVSRAAQIEQVKTITSLMKERYGASGKPVFLAGDFNAVPGSGTMGQLEKDWKIISCPDPTFPSGRPDVCIDYILALDNGADFKVLDSAVYTGFSSGNVKKASDHLPLYVDVRLK